MNQVELDNVNYLFLFEIYHLQTVASNTKQVCLLGLVSYL